MHRNVVLCQVGIGGGREEVEREAKAEEKVGEVEVKFSTADKEGGAFGVEC